MNRQFWSFLGTFLLLGTLVAPPAVAEQVTSPTLAADRTAPTTAPTVDLDRLERLTDGLLQSGRHALFGPVRSPEASAAERAQLFAQLIETDPATALRLAIPAEVRAALPPSVQAHVERQVRLSGQIQRLVAFGGRLTQERSLYLLTGEKQPSRSLSFASLQAADGWLNGHVTLQGVELSGRVAVASYQVTRTASPYTVKAGARKIAIFPLGFSDDPTAYFTPTEAKTAFFTAPSSTNQFIQTLSGGAVSLTGQRDPSGDAYPQATMATTTVGCPYATYLDEGLSAAAANGVSPNSLQHLVFAFSNANCEWAGLATMEGKTVWYNDYYTPLRTYPEFAATVLNHELGHNFGLQHAAGLWCEQEAQWTAINGDCFASEYGEPYDTMGNAFGLGRYSSFNMSRLGWLDLRRIKSVTRAGLYTLAPANAPGNGIHTLKISRPVPLTIGGVRTSVDYYLEYRQPSLPELFAPDAPLYRGLSIRLAERERWAHTYLIDTVPESATWDDAPLTSGSYVDCDGRLRISLVGLSPAGAQVQVEPNLSHFTSVILSVPHATQTATIPLKLDASNPCADLLSYRLYDGRRWSDWQPWTGSLNTTLTLPSGDGVRTVRVELKDSLKRVASFSAPVTVDTTGPIGSVKINGGAPYTTDQATLTLAATDRTGVSEVRLSADGQVWSDWQPFSPTTDWSFAGETGEAVTVWAQFRDELGNPGAPVSDSAKLDLTGPTGALTINRGAAATNNPRLSLTLTASDTPAGISQMRFSSDGGTTWTEWEPYRSSKALTIPAESGTWTIQAQLQDKAGNIAAPLTASIELDATQPTLESATTDGAYLWLHWSEPLLPNLRISSANFSVKVNGRSRSVLLQPSQTSGSVLGLKLSSPLQANDLVTLTLRRGAVKDQAGNASRAVTTPVSVQNDSRTP